MLKTPGVCSAALANSSVPGLLSLDGLVGGAVTAPAPRARAVGAAPWEALCEALALGACGVTGRRRRCCCFCGISITRLSLCPTAFLRYVPVEDLLGIYKKLYGREAIPRNAIVDCTYLQFLEM